MAEDIFLRAGGGFGILATPKNLTPRQIYFLKSGLKRCVSLILAPPRKLPPNSTLKILVVAEPLSAGQNATTQPGPTWENTGLPSTATVRLQTSALGDWESHGRLGDLILHEFLHCLGFGCSWGPYGLIGKPLSGDEVAYVGKRGVAAYQTMIQKAGGTEKPVSVPIELDGGGAQKALHWRESVFGDELMSAAQRPERPTYLSPVTLAALEDLGYQIDGSKADPIPVTPYR